MKVEPENITINLPAETYATVPIQRAAVVEIYRLFDSLAQENVAAAIALANKDYAGVRDSLDTVDNLADKIEEKFELILTDEERDG